MLKIGNKKREDGWEKKKNFKELIQIFLKN